LLPSKGCGNKVIAKNEINEKKSSSKTRVQANSPCYLHNFVLPLSKFDMNRGPPKCKKHENEKANIANVDGVIQKIDQLVATKQEHV
jgi:hypothetical protein